MTQFLTNLSDVIDFLETHKVSNYKIRDDLTADIDENVYINDSEWEYLPVQFGVIKGSFSCSRNKLKSLKGCPHEVHGDFMCSENQLISLEHGPVFVGSDYYCYKNKLTTLCFAPKVLLGDLIARDNFLTTLEGSPETIGGKFYFENNQVQNFQGAPRYVGYFIQCSNNPLNSFDELTGKFSDIYFTKQAGFIDDIEEFLEPSKDGIHSISHHRLQNFLLYRRLFGLCVKPESKTVKI